MLNFIDRRNKDYSRHNILKSVLGSLPVHNDIYILLPFSKKKFLPLLIKKKIIINDFFISDFDTYVYDRKKGSIISPSAIYKFMLDWINFRFSQYLLSDTQSHFIYWENLFGKFRGKHLVFPVLADPNIYYPKKPKSTGKTPTILFYGHFIPLHGINIILNALKKCEDRGIKFHAELIGEGQTLPAMLTLATELSLRQVTFNKKLIPERDLADRICNSDIVLGIFGESRKAKSVVPNKVYQALACQSAVITQDTPAIREFFTDEQLCLVNGEPDALANAIEKLINNTALRLQLAENGYASYQKIYEKSIDSLIKFIIDIDKRERCGD